MTDLNTEDFEMHIQPHPEDKDILLVGVYTRKYDRSAWTSINDEALKEKGINGLLEIIEPMKEIMNTQIERGFFDINYQDTDKDEKEDIDELINEINKLKDD